MQFFNVIKGSKGSYSRKIKELRVAIRDADAIVIGAGKGFVKAAARNTGSASDGRWASFRRKFFDFTVEYGIQNVRAGMYYPFMSSEERWAWLSRVIWWKKYETDKSPVYEKLLSILDDKKFFVVTSEPDNLFEEHGFPEEYIFEMMGTYAQFQCDYICESYTFPNKDIVKRMMESQGFEYRDGKMEIPEGVVSSTRIAPELVPICPMCGGRVSPNIAINNELVQDDRHFEMSLLYDAFLRENAGKHITFIEMGVGRNAEQEIRRHFWDLCGDNLHATYVNINLGGTYCPANMESRSILIESDIRKVIKDLL